MSNSEPIKSALERALERFGAEESPVVLNDEDRAELRAITQTYEAKIAEKKIMAQDRVNTLMAAGKLEEARAAESELAGEIASLQEKMEREKSRVRERAKQREA